MTADEIRQTARRLPLTEGTGYSWLRELVCDGFMNAPVSREEIVHRINEKFGRRRLTTKSADLHAQIRWARLCS